MAELASKAQLRWSLARAAMIAVPLVLLLGTLSGRLSGSGEANPWFAALTKPDAYPPGFVFGIAWTILYTMLGIAVALVWNARGAPRRGLALGLFALQLAANLAWSPLFFRYHQIEPAFWLVVVIFVLALATTIVFGSIRRLAAWLMVPYLAWLGFAAVLNWRVHELNPGTGPNVSTASVRLDLPAQE
jgi:translocator protein